jgi:hypothetical protein
MLFWLRRRRETAERIDAEADVLFGEVGVEAYAKARRRIDRPRLAVLLNWTRNVWRFRSCVLFSTSTWPSSQEGRGSRASAGSRSSAKNGIPRHAC